MTPRDLTLPRAARWLRIPAAAIALMVITAGCSERKPDATQVAARVNDADITVHQIAFLRLHDRNTRPDQDEAANKRVLESLIDQELAVQKAIELKLDREPQNVQALEAARREVLARAYKDRVAQAVTRGTPEEARRYYEETPALFKERRVYTLQELVVDAPQAKLPWINEQLAKAKSADEFAEVLKADGLRFTGSHTVKPAEQLPMGLVEQFAKMKDGDSAVVSEAPMLRIVFIAASHLEPVAYERAAPAIEQYLATLAKRRAIDDNLKALRTAAHITYQGKYVGGPASPASGAANLPAMAPAQLPDASPEPVQLKVPDAAPPPAETAGSGIDPNIAKKGMGLK